MIFEILVVGVAAAGTAEIILIFFEIARAALKRGNMKEVYECCCDICEDPLYEVSSVYNAEYDKDIDYISNEYQEHYRLNGQTLCQSCYNKEYWRQLDKENEE